MKIDLHVCAGECKKTLSSMNYNEFAGEIMCTTCHRRRSSATANVAVVISTNSSPDAATAGLDDDNNDGDATSPLNSYTVVPVSQTVRPMLSDCCLSCLSFCLSVTLVYCDQTVEWIKMPLGTEVGLGQGHIVLDEEPVPPRKRAQQPPIFLPVSIVAKRSCSSVSISAFVCQQLIVVNSCGIKRQFSSANGA